MHVGMNCEELYHSGITRDQFKKMNFALRHLAVNDANGCPLMGLAALKRFYDIDAVWLHRELDVSAEDLCSSANTADDYMRSGYTAKDFKTIESIVSTGIAASDFVRFLGLTRRQFSALRPSTSICRETGWSYAAIKQAFSCSDSAMGDMGFGLVPNLPLRA